MFDLVKQFDAMRQGVVGELGTPQLPAVAQIQYQRKMMAAQPQAGGQFPAPAGGQPAATPRSAGAAMSGGVGQKFQSFDQTFGSRLRMTSGYRDPDHNRRVGGVPNSWHTKKDEHGHERARDYVGSARDMQEGAAWARQNGAQEVLIHNVGSGQHLHIAW